MVDIDKTNLPKDDSPKKVKAQSKSVAKRISTQDEPVRKSKLTKTFSNVSRNTIYIGSLAIPVGKQRVLPNAVADAFIENDYNTKLYLKNKALKID